MILSSIASASSFFRWNVLRPMIEFFNNLSPGMQSAISVFAVLAAALTPVIVAFSALVSAVQGLIALFGEGGALAGAGPAGGAPCGRPAAAPGPLCHWWPPYLCGDPRSTGIG